MNMKGVAAAAAVVVGASARLTRFVVTDSLGQWLIKDPIDQAAESWYMREQRQYDAECMKYGMEPGPVPQPWWWKYREGLDCPFCVGFWIGAGVLAVEHVSRETSLRPAARFVGTALTLNYVVGHLSSRIDTDHEQTAEQQAAANTYTVNLLQQPPSALTGTGYPEEN